MRWLLSHPAVRSGVWCGVADFVHARRWPHHRRAWIESALAWAKLQPAYAGRLELSRGAARQITGFVWSGPTPLVAPPGPPARPPPPPPRADVVE